MSQDQLPGEWMSEVNRVLTTHLTPYGGFDIAWTMVHRRNGDYAILVAPVHYPERMFDFFGALADAEIELRDAGLQVRLMPNVRQKLLVVLRSDRAPEPYRERDVAFLSTDGSEWSDYAHLVGLGEIVRSGVLEGYPFDSSAELREAIGEVRALHPDAIPLGELESSWELAA
jgi:hypothetical protein